MPEDNNPAMAPQTDSPQSHDGSDDKMVMYSSAWYAKQAQEHLKRAHAIEHDRPAIELELREVYDLASYRLYAAHLESLSRIASKLEQRGIRPEEILADVDKNAG